MNEKKKIIIIGAGGHSRIVINIAELNNYKIECIIDVNFLKGRDVEKIFGYPVIGNIDILDKFSPDEFCVFIAIGDNETRTFYYNLLRKKKYFIPRFIHPATTLSKHISIGEGVLINAGVIINSGTVIGENTVLNTNSSIDHECVIGNNVHIAPGVIIAGRVTIGASTMVGIGSTIIENIIVFFIRKNLFY